VRRAVAVFALLAASASACAQDVAPEERAFVEIVATKPRWFVGETIQLRLRVGYDVEYFDRHAVQSFQQRLDVPFRIEAPWLRRPVGAELVSDSSAPRGSTQYSHVLNDAVVWTSAIDPEARNGRTYRVLEAAKAYRASRAGDVVVPAPTLRFAHADRFEENFMQGSAPVGRRDIVVHGAAPTLHVVDLPTEGRPPEFVGAVGSFEVGDFVDRNETAVGDAIKLTLTVTGPFAQGVDLPRLADLAGFHVYGMVEEKPSWGRSFVYDIAPLDDRVTSIPPIAFAYFDPDAGRYRVVKTDAIPLRVRPSPSAAHVEPRAMDDAGASRWVVAAGLVVAALVVVGVLVRRRRQRGDPRDVGGGHVRDAAAAFRAQADADVAASLAAFLAACLRCTPAAVVSPDLAARLVAAGATSDVAGRAAALLERLVAARYGGEASTDDAAAAREVVDEIESAFTSAG